MVVLEGRTWLEVLSPEACWQLAETQEVGRVAVEVDGLAEIFPVNFVVEEQTVVFRTDRGSKLDGLRTMPTVCFEVDGVDGAARSGWSVMIKGRARELAHGDEVAEAHRLPLEYWAEGEKSAWIRIEPHAVSGRRVHRPAHRRPRGAGAADGPPA